MTRNKGTESPAKVSVSRYTIAPPHMCEVRLRDNITAVETENGTGYEWNEYVFTHPYSEGLGTTIEANFDTWIGWAKENDIREKMNPVKVVADIDFLKALQGIV